MLSPLHSFCAHSLVLGQVVVLEGPAAHALVAPEPAVFHAVGDGAGFPF